MRIPVEMVSFHLLESLYYIKKHAIISITPIDGDDFTSAKALNHELMEMINQGLYTKFRDILIFMLMKSSISLLSHLMPH